MFDTGTNWTDKLIHLAVFHRYRDCSQDLYTSMLDFGKHLRESHAFRDRRNYHESSEPLTFVTFEQPHQTRYVLDAKMFPFPCSANESGGVEGEILDQRRVLQASKETCGSFISPMPPE
jgi:hypothetical protein